MHDAFGVSLTSLPQSHLCRERGSRVWLRGDELAPGQVHIRSGTPQPGGKTQCQENTLISAQTQSFRRQLLLSLVKPACPGSLCVSSSFVLAPLGAWQCQNLTAPEGLISHGLFETKLRGGRTYDCLLLSCCFTGFRAADKGQDGPRNQQQVQSVLELSTHDTHSSEAQGRGILGRLQNFAPSNLGKLARKKKGRKHALSGNLHAQSRRREGGRWLGHPWAEMEKAWAGRHKVLGAPITWLRPWGRRTGGCWIWDTTKRLACQAGLALLPKFCCLIVM